mgnify:CR=1 FL=1
MSELVTDAMVEAARVLLAAEGADSQDGWHSWRCFDTLRYPEPCDCTAQAARSALEDAAPAIAAKAWEAGFDTGTTHGIAYQAGDNDALARPDNPYCADRIEHDARCPHPKCPGHGMCCCPEAKP